MEVRNTRTAFLALLGIILSVSACTQAVESGTDATAMPAESERRKPVFRSAKNISSICEVDDWPLTFPGFKEPPGSTMRELPPPTTDLENYQARLEMHDLMSAAVATGRLRRHFARARTSMCSLWPENRSIFAAPSLARSKRVFNNTLLKARLTS